MALGLPQAVLAQSAAPGAVDEIVVTAQRQATDARLAATPGGTATLEQADLPRTANLTIARALTDVPGVVVQDFFGANDQPRIQLRGSGLQQNPVERGVLMLHNGLPLNRADGSYVVGFANPGESAGLEVYRGYTANRLGATVLGGAINLKSPTGRSAPGLVQHVSGGSFGQIGGGAQVGFAGEDHDLLFRADAVSRTGFRDYNSSRRVSAGGNVGMRLSDAFSLRVFGGYTDLGFDVTGPLTQQLLETDRRAIFTGPTVTLGGVINPGPNVVRDQPRRDSTQWLVGTRATGIVGPHNINLALGYTHTDDLFRFPMSGGFRATDGGDVTATLRYAFVPDSQALLPLAEVTAYYVSGAADRQNFINLAGRRGPQFGNSRLSADTLSLFGGLNVPLDDRLTLSPSLSWARSTRDNADRFAAPTRPTASFSPLNPAMPLPPGAVPTVSTSYTRTYTAWNPALALSYRLSGDQILFAALSRSFEPPTHDDLLATINGTPNSSAGRPNPGNPALPAAAFVTPALEAQRATTLEAGWRGGAGPVQWDAVVYYAWVDNELLSLRDASGVSLGAANAGQTRRLGVELATSLALHPTLTARLVYTYQDFRFRNDPSRGNNRVAGAPRHWVHGRLSWRPDARWTAEAAIRWMPERTPVDNFATLFNDPFAVADLRAEYRIADRWSLFAEVTNLFDKTYAASTLIVDQARPDQAAFLPGDGRAIGGGIRLTF